HPSRDLLLCRRRTPRPTLFPYTTLFRSKRAEIHQGQGMVRIGHCPGEIGHRQPRDPAMVELHEFAIDLHAPHLVEMKVGPFAGQDRKSTRLNSSHVKISYAVFCLKKKIK